MTKETINKHPPQFIDMSDDIYNLGGAADIVMEQVKNAIELRKKGRGKKPIFVLLGEDHSKPLTQLFQLAVLQKCIQHGFRTAFGYEARYDFMLEKNVYATLKPNKNIDCYLSIPVHHRETLDPDLILSCTTDEPILHAIGQFCEQHSISLMFNDAARNHSRTGTPYLINNDPINQRVAKALSYRLQKNALDWKVQHIRNHILAEHILDQAERDNPDILVQMLGDAHVLGDDDRDFSYGMSITRIMREQAACVIPVTTSMETEEFPDDIDLTDALIFEGWQDTVDMNDRSLPIYKKFVRTTSKRAGLPIYDDIAPKERRRRHARFTKNLRQAVEQYSLTQN